MSEDNGVVLAASKQSLRTSNPIRNIVDRGSVQPNPEKAVLSLSIGDPTVFGNLQTPSSATDAVVEACVSGKYNGYFPAFGMQSAREAIANRFTSDSAILTDKDVIITSGCSQAVEFCFMAVANEGDNILVPRPAFSLYETLLDSMGLEMRNYNLKAEHEWEADLTHLESQITEKTKAILVNNPSNPCGSVYSKEHLIEILKVAEKHKLPIIADEIYANMVFEGVEFHHMARLTSTVPVLSLGGLAKQYLVPGWRIGWILLHDRGNQLKEIREGLLRLTMRIVGPNSLVQAAVPKIFSATPKSFYTDLNKTLQEQAEFCTEHLSRIEGLRPIRAKGAMYLMVQVETEKFKDISSDVDFFEKLFEEESVHVLPGTVFGMQYFFRIVTCPPIEKLSEAIERIENFCSRHRQ